ncbi:MAG: Fimbrial protein [Dehalococcoidia bacterium]|nr:Fimbrial protein [Chloroflexota bacterium]
MSTKTSGFTLIEIMIVVLVVAILAALAYPSYQNQVRKGRMGQAQADLLEAAQFMERCFAVNNSYAACALPFTASPRTGTSYYTIAFTGTPTRTAFTLRATPTVASGQHYQICGHLSIDQTGARAFDTAGGATAAQCW